MENIINSVRDRVLPDSDERQELQEAANTLRDEIYGELDSRGLDDVSVTQTGSTARGTWVSGDRDIDMFLEFPAEIPESELEEYGLAIGEAVVPDGRRDYAAHPYTKGTFNGFEVDVVPCYAVDSASNIQSAVDRTPFHTRYLEDRLTGDLAAEVVLMKQFMKGVGVYGSDVKTGGFSGYLTELLVLEYGGFGSLLEAASEWEPPLTVDPENHAAELFEDPLTVIDPTDPERNVAAALTAQKLAEFQHAARQFLTEPSESFFTIEEPDPLTEAELDVLFDQRGTTPVALALPIHSDLVEDTLYPQAIKTLDSLVESLEDRDFPVVDAYPLVTEARVALLVELATETLPDIQAHQGPPVCYREAAENFVQAHEANPASTEPTIVGNRFMVYVERDFTSAVDYFVSDAIRDELTLGPALEQAWSERTVVSPESVTDLASEFGSELAETRLNEM